MLYIRVCRPDYLNILALRLPLHLLLVLQHLLLVLLPEDLLAGLLDGLKDLRLRHYLLLHILHSWFGVDIDEITQSLGQVFIVIGLLLDLIALDQREGRIGGIRSTLPATSWKYFVVDKYINIYNKIFTCKCIAKWSLFVFPLNYAT